MAIIRNVQKVIMPAATKGMPEVITYLNEEPWSAGSDVIVLTNGGSFYRRLGNNFDVLNAPIIASDIVIPVLDTVIHDAWPATGYLLIGSEVIQYSSWTFASFVLSSPVLRGAFGTTAAGHTAADPIAEILPGVVSNIEYDTDAGLVNVWSTAQQYVWEIDPQSLSHQLVSTTPEVSLFSIPDDNISLIEL
jgi:hypothetical protein